MQLRDLQRQYEVLKPAIDEALLGVAASGGYILGETVAHLEHRLARYVGTQHCISCASGTDALSLALMTWNVGKGDAVFVPDFTFFASAEVVALRGATPIFVDVERESFNMDVEDLKRKIEQVEHDARLRPYAVIAVDLFGLPANMPAIKEVTHSHGMYLLEDAAQGFGGRLGGRKACSFGDMAATSFFPAKPLGCYGDGGAVFTDNEEWALLLQSLRLHGKGEDKYHNVRLGLNSRLDALQAAVLEVKMDAFENSELQRVNAVAEQYHEGLHDVVACPQLSEDQYSSWAQYTIRLKDGSQRDRLQQFLKIKGIPSVVYYALPMHLQPVFQNEKYKIDTPPAGCPNAEELSQTVLSLPMHPYLTQEEIRQVIVAVREGIKENDF